MGSMTTRTTRQTPSGEARADQARLQTALRHAWPWLLLFALSLPVVTTRIYASDEVQYFVFLRSMWFDHDLSFDNDYHYFDSHGIASTPAFRATVLEQPTETGLRLNYGTIGCALLWAPFYAGADALARLMPGTAADGLSHPYIASVCYGSAFYAFAALVLSVVAVRRMPGQVAAPHRRWARTSALLVLVSTPLLFYAYVAPVFAHACSAFAVALFVVTWLHVRNRWSARGLAALGAATALMAMVREQDVFFAAGPAVDFAFALAGRRSDGETGALPGDRASVPRLLASAAAGCAAFALVWLPQAIAYLVLNGHIGPSRLVTRKMTWTAPHALQVVFSSTNGFLFWTPLFAIALAGLLLLALGRAGSADGRRVAACMLVMVAAQIYIAGSVESWTVAGAFGQRRFVALTVLLVIGVSAVLVWARTRLVQVLAAIVLAACAWWNIALMVQFATATMDRQRLALGANAYNAFVVVPRELPSLVYRYLFDRKSFYATPPGGVRRQ
jgi:hypothetical protein